MGGGGGVCFRCFVFIFYIKTLVCIASINCFFIYYVHNAMLFLFLHLTAQCTDLSFSTCEEVLSYNRTYFPNPTALDRDSAISLIEDTSSLEECHEDFLLLFCGMLLADCPHGGPSRRPCKALCEEVTDACRDSYLALVDAKWPIDCSQLSDEDNLEESYCIGGEGGKLSARESIFLPSFQLQKILVINVHHTWMLLKNITSLSRLIWRQTFLY